MDVDIQNYVQPKTPDDSQTQSMNSKADDEGDSWTDVSDECSVASDGGAAAPPESTIEEGSKCHSNPGPFTVAKRRWTNSPVKRLSSTILNKRFSRKYHYHKRVHPRFSTKLATIFERQPATGPPKLSTTLKRRHKSTSLMGRRLLEFFRRTFNRSVEEVDELMMNLEIHQQNQM